MSERQEITPNRRSGDVESVAEDLKKGPAVSADPEALAHRQAVERRLVRKLDFRCSIFVLIYILNYLDRNNIGAVSCFRLRLNASMSADTLHRRD